MLRFLLLAVLLACVSAFVPPATLAQRSVVGRAASVEMGASKGNLNLLKKPKDRWASTSSRSRTSRRVLLERSVQTRELV